MMYDTATALWVPNAGDDWQLNSCGAWLTTDGYSVTIDTDASDYTLGTEQAVRVIGLIYPDYPNTVGSISNTQTVTITIGDPPCEFTEFMKDLEITNKVVTKDRTHQAENHPMDVIESNSCNYDAWTYNIMVNGTLTLADLGVSVDNSKDPPEFVTGGVTTPPSDLLTVKTYIYWWPIPDDHPDHPILYNWF